MGCCSSSALDDDQSHIEAQGPAAKRYFYLEDLPLSVSANPSGKRGLNVVIGGLETREGLVRLEAAFYKRGFQIRSARLLHPGDLVDERYLLEYTGLNSGEVLMNDGGTPTVTLELQDSSIAMQKLPGCEKVVNFSKEQNKLLYVAISGYYHWGQRAATVELLRKSGFPLVAGTLRTTGAAPNAQCDDELWLRPPNPEVSVDAIDKLQRGIESACAQCQVMALSSLGTPPKAYAAKSAADLVNALKQEDHMFLLKCMKGLPSSLRDGLKDVQYEIRGPCTKGFQIPGFVKFVGAGLAATHAVNENQKVPLDAFGKKQKRLAPMLEIRTLFIKEKNESEKQDALQWLRKTMNMEKEYAEFVTLLDVQHKEWMIYKAFLNSTLSAGKGLGAEAVAEHLLAEPSMFFHGGDSVLPDWMPSLAASIPELEMLHICDVVNWNTYMLMTMASSKERKLDMFGDPMIWAVKQELARSKISEQALKTLSVVEMYEHSNLGKFTLNTLKRLSDHCDMPEFEIVDVKVLFSNEFFEHIQGEIRRQMDLKVILQPRASKDPLTPKRQAKRKEMITQNALKIRADTIHHGKESTLTDNPMVDGIQPVSPSRTRKIATQVLAGSVDDVPEFRRLISPEEGRTSIPCPGVANFIGEDLLAEARANPAEGQKQWNSENLPKVDHQSMYCVLGLIRAMGVLVHQLQYERACVCLALGEASKKTVGGKTFGSPDGDNMKEQFEKTNLLIHTTMVMLNELWKPLGADRLSGVFQDGMACFHQAAVKVLVQRRLAISAYEQPPNLWSERYYIACGGSTGYHQLVAMIVRWMTVALRSPEFWHDGDELSERYRNECILLSAFKEQLGRERSFLACKGSAKINEDQRSKQILTSISEGRAKIYMLLGLGESGEDAGVPLVMLHFKEIEDNLSQGNELEGAAVQSWFTEMTNCMNRTEVLLRELYRDLRTFMPMDISDACVPMSTEAEMNVPQPIALDEELEDVAELAEQIRDRHFTNIVVLVGAGISVSANIPDFRSPGGLYDSLKKEGLACPEAVFTKDFVREKPQIFFDIMKRLRTDHIDPTPTHRFMRLLHQKGLLKRIYTQNIDGLERKAGLPEDILVESHGTMCRSKCVDCSKVHTIDEIWKEREANSFPRCSDCKGLLRPDIVFFGEPLPERFLKLCKPDLESADLVIVMGTSLSVHPFAGLVNQCSKDCPRLVVNLNLPQILRPRLWNKITSKLTGPQPRQNFFLGGKCEKRVMWLAGHLGWDDEMTRDQEWRRKNSKPTCLPQEERQSDRKMIECDI